MPPVAYSAAIPAASCLAKLAAYAEPIFSTSCLRLSGSAAAAGTENAASSEKHKAYWIRMCHPPYESPPLLEWCALPRYHQSKCRAMLRAEEAHGSPEA